MYARTLSIKQKNIVTSKRPHLQKLFFKKNIENIWYIKNNAYLCTVKQ